MLSSLKSLLLVGCCAVIVTTVSGVSRSNFYPYGSTDLINVARQNLPSSITINNLRGLSTPATAYLHKKGQLLFFGSSNYFRISISGAGSGGDKLQAGTSYTRVVTSNSSNATELLNNVKDHVNNGIANAFPSPPTAVLVATGIGIKSTDSTSPGTDYQLIVATNGQRTFGILMIAAIETEAATHGNRALMAHGVVNSLGVGYGTIFFYFPYHGKFLQATNLNLNSERNGEYIFQIDNLPPPCKECNHYMLKLSCEVIKKRGRNPPSFCNNL